MSNRQNYETINKHLQDILNAIIDVRRAYSGGYVDNKKKDYAMFNNITETLSRLDEIKYKSQDALECMFVLELKEE